MEFISLEMQKKFSNENVVSMQLLSPHNSTSKAITITSVDVAPNGVQPRHKHENSEQTWIAIEGKATLLLKDGDTKEFSTGEVVRFEKGDIHGIHNHMDTVFKYISVTAPPIDFGYAYKNKE